MTDGRARPKPSLFDVVFGIWAIVIPIGFSDRLLSSDGDLARHLRLGDLMLSGHGLLRTDVFSFTAAGKPFLAFEWGAEVIYAIAERVGGLALVAVVAALLLALTFALVARFMVRRGGDPFLAYLVSTAVAVLTAGHWLARPHLFTLVLVVVLLDLLDREQSPPLWVIALLFAIWANLHGGFVYGFILVGAYLTGDLLEAGQAGDPKPRLASARRRALALVVAVVATLANPHGFGLLAHVVSFFGQGDILRQTNEFLSPNFHTINGKMFLVVLLVVIGSLALARHRPPWARLLVILGNIAMALLAQRNIELFAIGALPLAALHVDAEWRALPILGRARSVFQQEYRGSYSGLAAGLVAALMMGLGFGHGRLGSIRLIDDSFDPRAFPVNVALEARHAGVTGPMFNQFIWGGWMMHDWPEMPVFIDGGTDHYGEVIFNEYLQVWNLEPGWRDVLAKWGIRWALVDPNAPLAHELVREPGWGVWRCDSVGVLLGRAPEVTDTGAAGIKTLDGCSAPPGHVAR